MSNTERQRRFRERNPGYYGRLHRRRNAMATAPVALAVTESQPTVLLLPAPMQQLPLFPDHPLERVPLMRPAMTPETIAA